jgi:hypothetical protein
MKSYSVQMLYPLCDLISFPRQPAFNDLHGDDVRDTDAQSAEVSASPNVKLSVSMRRRWFASRSKAAMQIMN